MGTDAKSLTDMVMPEGYQRAKRAALTFSAILLVVSLADPSKPITLLGSNAASINHWVAVALLWIAATYYVICYQQEFKAAQSLNSDWQLRDAAKSFEQRLVAIVYDIERQHGKIIERGGQLGIIGLPDRSTMITMVNALNSSIGDTMLRLESLGTAAPSRLPVSQSAEARLERLGEAIEAFRKVSDAAVGTAEKYMAAEEARRETVIENLADTLATAKLELESAVAALNGIKDAVMTLSDRIVRERVIAFHWLDRRAVLVLWTAASLAYLLEPTLRHLNLL